MPEPLRLGTRGSQLALTQSQQVALALTEATGIPVELTVIQTRGDRVQDRPLPEIGGKGLFTEELDRALAAGEIDLAVHSLKDLPTEDPAGLVLGAIPRRVDPRDALVGPPVAELPEGAVIGSGSLRRRTQLSDIRSDLEMRDIRGNVPTRLRKRDEGLFAATILAMAGLERLGIDRDDIHPFDIDQMVPAVGQGALGVQCRAADATVLDALASIDDADTRRCVMGERAFLAEFGGGCNVPAGAHIWLDAGRVHLLACVAREDGVLRRVREQGDDAIALGQAAAKALRV